MCSTTTTNVGLGDPALWLSFTSASTLHVRAVGVEGESFWLSKTPTPHPDDSQVIIAAPSHNLTLVSYYSLVMSYIKTLHPIFFVPPISGLIDVYTKICAYHCFIIMQKFVVSNTT